MSKRRKTLSENIIRSARVLRNHLGLTALPRQVAPAKTTPNRVTTPAPPHVNGPQGCSLHTGDAETITNGPPNKDNGENASLAL